MTAIVPFRVVLLVAFALLLGPATAAHAAPSAHAPAAAHQDDVGDDDTADDPDLAEDLDEVVDDATDVVDDLGEEDDWGDDDAEDEGVDDWGDEEETEDPVIEYVKGKTVAGKVAMLRRDGRAAIPRNAPKRVKLLITAANRIVGKPYKWGGGHAKLDDRGYDCSGTVSYALIRAGLLDGPLTSGGFAKWARADAGRWVTIYANKGHVYMEVAGLRLDTSPMGDTGGKGPRWRPAIGKRPGFKVRHIAGL